MKLSVIEKRLPLWYKEAISGRPNACRCIYLKSAPGRGKTETLASAPALIGAALNVNLGLVIINGPLLNPPDSVGYLVPKHGEGYAESIFTSPFWWRTVEGKRLEEYDGGIIVVDEADKMDVDVKKVIGEAALSGRLGPHILPPGWVVWMAGNTSEHRSGSTKELDHLINRRREIDVSDDLDSWQAWAAKKGVMPITKAFVHNYTEIVFSKGVPKDQGPWCTPRSMVMADSFLQTVKEVFGSIPENDPDVLEEVTGNIGPAACSQYFTFVKLDNQMPKFEDIVKKPKDVKVPEAPDARMLICYHLAHRVTSETASSVVTYMERMPKEFAVTFAHSACKRDFKLVMNQAFQSWAQRNSSLMAALAR